jgi:hypothetical protein
MEQTSISQLPFSGKKSSNTSNSGLRVQARSLLPNQIEATKNIAPLKTKHKLRRLAFLIIITIYVFDAQMSSHH